MMNAYTFRKPQRVPNENWKIIKPERRGAFEEKAPID